MLVVTVDVVFGETALSLTAHGDSSVNREERQRIVELLRERMGDEP